LTPSAAEQILQGDSGSTEPECFALQNDSRGAGKSGGETSSASPKCDPPPGPAGPFFAEIDPPGQFPGAQNPHRGRPHPSRPNAIHHQGLPARSSVKTGHRPVFRALGTPKGDNLISQARKGYSHEQTISAPDSFPRGEAFWGLKALGRGPKGRIPEGQTYAGPGKETVPDWPPERPATESGGLSAG